MKFIIKGCDSYYRWDCQYKEEIEFNTEQEAIDYCKELFGDDKYILEAAE